MSYEKYATNSGNQNADEQPAVKLRILLLGWNIGSGSTGVFIDELARYLSGRGHVVTCLSAGRCDWRVRPHLHVAQTQPYELIELRNPPVMFGARPDDPRVHVDSAKTGALLRSVLSARQPHVAAIIDYPGWPASTVEVCQREGSKVLVYLQNFWPVCTRLSLYSRWKEVCYDYRDGEKCVACMADVTGSSAARWRNRLPSALWGIEKFRFMMKKVYQGIVSTRSSSSAITAGAGYAIRRRAYVDGINKADLLVAISGGSLKTAEIFGVSGKTVRELPVRFLSQAHLRQSRDQRATRTGEGGPLNFAYLGAVVPEKGVEILVSAFRGIPASCARLDIYGTVSSDYKKYLESLSDLENPPVFHGRYDRRGLGPLLRNVHLGIVPSNCEDTLPSTVTEFHALGIPVIGSQIGGIPNQIDDGKNGLLFKPGDVESLGAVMRHVIGTPEVLAAWRDNLPSSFEPECCWLEFERYCIELSSTT